MSSKIGVGDDVFAHGFGKVNTAVCMNDRRIQLAQLQL